MSRETHHLEVSKEPLISNLKASKSLDLNNVRRFGTLNLSKTNYQLVNDNDTKNDREPEWPKKNPKAFKSVDRDNVDGNFGTPNSLKTSTMRSNVDFFINNEKSNGRGPQTIHTNQNHDYGEITAFLECEREVLKSPLTESSKHPDRHGSLSPSLQCIKAEFGEDRARKNTFFCRIIEPFRRNKNEPQGTPATKDPVDVNLNTYQQKKTLAQGMMDLALLSSNANQLRYVVETSKSHPYYYLNLVFIGVSIMLQVAVGIGLIINSRYDVTEKDKGRVKADKINNKTVLGVFLVTIINVFITSFSVAAPNATGCAVSSAVQTAGKSG